MLKPRIRLAFVAFLLATLSVVVSPGFVQAAGVVGTGTPASCTEAALNTALSGGGSISFNCGGAATIVLTAPKALVANTTLNGGGVITLSGNNSTRLFFVNGGVQFTLNSITLIKGNSPVGGGVIEATGAQIVLNNTRVAQSAAKDQGGAIYCFEGTGGTLTLNNSVIDGNTSARGGGIYNDGCALTLNNSHISNNTAVASATVINPSGGGVYNAGPLSSSGSTFSGNRALDGGALYVAAGFTAELNGATISGNGGGYGGGIENSGALTVTNSLIQGNSVTGSGGGLWNLGGVAHISRTTISDNTAGEGGGVNSYGSHVELADVNITGNTATTSHGGGIYLGTGTLFATNATISGNRATDAGGDGGGIYQNSDDNLTLTNVTISQNQAGRFGGGFYHKGRFAILTNVTMGAIRRPPATRSTRTPAPRRAALASFRCATA